MVFLGMISVAFSMLLTSSVRHEGDLREQSLTQDEMRASVDRLIRDVRSAYSDTTWPIETAGTSQLTFTVPDRASSPVERRVSYRVTGGTLQRAIGLADSIVNMYAAVLVTGLLGLGDGEDRPPAADGVTFTAGAKGLADLHGDGGIVGEAAVDFISQFKVDHAVIGASALDEDGAMLDFDYREVRVAKAIMQNARNVMLVADGMKFTRTAPVRIGHLSDVDTFVTDRTPPEPIVELCRDSGVHLEIAGDVTQTDTDMDAAE